MLVHAGVCDARMWDGFDLPGATRHELRGFGQTPLPPAGEFSHADDLSRRLGDGPAALVGASYGGWVCLQVGGRAARAGDRAGPARCAAARPRLVATRWSTSGREEDGLLEQGDLRGAAILERRLLACAAPEPRERVIEMQERALELAARVRGRGSATPSRSTSRAITARTLVAVGELDKPDFHAIAERLAREIAGARQSVIDGGRGPPARRSSARGRPRRWLQRDFLQDLGPA